MNMRKVILLTLFEYHFDNRAAICIKEKVFYICINMNTSMTIAANKPLCKNIAVDYFARHLV